MINTENRNSERYEFVRPIVYAYRNSAKFFSACILNYNTAGICLQSNYPIPSGIQIYIMTEDGPIDDFVDVVDESFLAEIVWCEKLNGSYKIGVRYA